ncbi:pyridoxamine 5'-phosphate oxidase family protein [Sulfitobacter geojensis]|uniref:pyridoxamine 5'-phosphate oxidase family protein n=1 Tax=Sulfitobacter geojensis TaxID=1342299 RepID=UPI00046AC3E8|nr:pyridoxamine 5'-phosphate oxidase family protein [Sulfitobacter geojensis]KHA51803.1 Pyridoxamine 5'-phosphate oxidase [Sulfitobacter geojensis]NYI29213.1 pyridoxine/pyridoxamine 5'-phosphate oxidase [Sulfitobacter geojensis]
MSDPNDLVTFLDAAWEHLERGVAHSASPARFVTFATVGQDGVPQARTVALRGADRGAASVEVHTDVETDKVAALRQMPMAALHIWLPEANLQIRLTARVTVLTGSQVDEAWAKVPAGSRVSYGTKPTPGTPIADVYAYEKPAERSRFAVLKCELTQMDLVHLDARHRRALFEAQNGWQGTWVAP